MSALHFKTRYVKFRSFFSKEQSQLISNSDASSIVDALKIAIRRNRKKIPSVLRMERKSTEIHLRFLKNNKFLSTWVNYLRTRLHHSAGEQFSFSWETKPHGDGKSGRPITSSSNPKGENTHKTVGTPDPEICSLGMRPPQRTSKIRLKMYEWSNSVWTTKDDDGDRNVLADVPWDWEGKITESEKGNPHSFRYLIFCSEKLRLLRGTLLRQDAVVEMDETNRRKTLSLSWHQRSVTVGQLIFVEV